MPSKRSRYNVDEYVAVPVGHTQPSTRHHTQYEMGDALRTSRVKTILNLEHEEPTIHADAILTDEVEIPDLIQMEDCSDDEGDDVGPGTSGFDDDIHRELEAAGLGEIHTTGAMKSKRVRKTHTVRRFLFEPSIFFFSFVSRTILWLPGRRTLISMSTSSCGLRVLSPNCNALELDVITQSARRLRGYAASTARTRGYFAKSASFSCILMPVSHSTESR